MPDVVGYRAKIGVVVPSTNTVVEHDYYAVRPRGITFHFGRMFIENPAIDSDEAFRALIKQIRASIEIAVRDVMTCKPDYLAMGMSAETFWGGVEGNRSFVERISKLSGGLGVSTGADACGAACDLLDMKRIAVFTPYQPVADAEVSRYFRERGLEVVRARGLQCPTATAIANVDEAQLRDVLRELDGPDVDGIIQVGTNLSMMRLADEAERWLGKPVLAINAVTLWHTLRALGFTDTFTGYGSLLRDH